MADLCGLEDLKALGAGRPAPVAIVALYRQAFAEFWVRTLWSRTPSERPTIAQALVAAEGLRHRRPSARALASSPDIAGAMIGPEPEGR